MSAFLFIHFRYGKPEVEQVHFAVSKDGLHWEALNGGKPIMEQTEGEEGGIRDPFIYRKPDGTFIILATDLCLFKHWERGWEPVINNGSKDIIIWESPDLVNWSGPRRLTIDLPGLGCVWAPEVFFDETRQKSLLIWSSKLAGEEFMKVYAAYTDDFITYEKPFMFVEGKKAVLDTDLVRDDDGTYYRFTSNAFHDMTVMEKAPALEGPWTMVEDYNLMDRRVYEGPIAYRLPDGRWCLLLDHFGPVKSRHGYNAFFADDLASGNFIQARPEEYSMPYKMKHGGVMKITDEEYQRLKNAF